MNLLVVTSHPIQYQTPIFRELAKSIELEVYFAHADSPEDQAAEDFGVPFKWDRDLKGGYPNHYLENVARDPGFSRFFGCNTPEIHKILRPRNPDAVLVMGWNLYAYWQTIVACKMQRIPILVRGDSRLNTPRTKTKRMLKELSHRALLNVFDRCLYVGEESRKYFRHYGVLPDKLIFSPHAVDNDWFSVRSKSLDKNALRRECGIREDVKVVLFVGKFVQNKRPLDLLYAAKDFGENVEVVYVGAGMLEREIVQKSREMNVKTHMLGFKNQTEMPSVYSMADVLVLLSTSETWGLVVNEALACGLPVVASDGVGCVPDLIEPGVTGYIYPVGNVHALSNAIHNILWGSSKSTYHSSVRGKISLYSPKNAALGIIRAMESIKYERSCYHA